ncbi:hypothetical protein D3C71_1292130 [compost metagenome]
MRSLVIDSAQLSHDALLKLIDGECLALRVRNFFDPALCQQLTTRIMTYEGLRSFKYATNMDRFGPSLAEVAGSEDALGEYLATAVDEVAKFRRLCAPFLSPIDLLRLQLDEAWIAGANLATVSARKAFTGVARILRDGGFTGPHQDALASPHVDLSSFIAEQLAANIYLQTSTHGGQLELWDLHLEREEYQSIRSPGKVGITREKLRACDVALKPEQGDLILFRSTRLHAIREASGAPRVTCSSFIGYHSVNEPLVFYC